MNLDNNTNAGTKRTKPTVTIEPVIPGRKTKALTVLLGSSPPKVTSEGGWLVVNRPKTVGFTAWEGYSPRTMDITLMLDGFSQGSSQEEEYRQLHFMMRNPVGASKQPAPVKLTGPIPLSDLNWVIQSIDEDSTSVLRSSDGQLLRVEVTLTLLEYIEADVLVGRTSVSPANRVLERREPTSSVATATAAVTGTGQYTVKVGDTLWGIAQRYLGAGKRYTEIASLNGIRNPNSVPVGTVLKLP